MDVRLEILPRTEVLAMARLGAYAETAPALWHDLWEALRARDLGPVDIHRMTGPYRRIKEVFPRLLGDWLPTSGHQADLMRPFLEIYLNDPRAVPEREILTDLCVPIAG